MKNDFLAATSFELRTPLNSIIGFSEFMLSQVFGPLDPPRYRDYVEDINTSARHLREIIDDMLDLSRLEKTLKKDEKSYRHLVDAAPDCICILHAGEITLINPASRQMFATPPTDTLVGRRFADFVHADDRRRFEGDLEDLVGQSTRVPMKFVALDGKEIDVEVSALAIDPVEDGAMMVVARDVTERKHAEEALQESEARFRHLVEQAADGILVHDLDGKIIDVNQRLCDTLGYTRDELLALSISDISLESQPADFTGLGEEIIADGPLTHQEHHRCKDGASLAVEVRISVFDSGGRQLLLVLARDISERKRMEQQLLQAQKMEAVGQLTGGIAHDFNNLLTVVLGNLEWLQERIGKDDDLSFIVESAADSARRGAELTQRLLAFSRKQPLQSKLIDLHETVLEMHPLIIRTLGETIAFEIKVSAGLWRIRTDPSQLQNAVLNLAINARDAMPEGGRLTVEVLNMPMHEADTLRHPGMQPDNYVMLAVSDTGTGMTPQVVEHAFEPFFTTKETGRGSGLGLSMIYGFVKQSEGYVEIDSHEGLGTTVRLYLPALEAHATDTPTVEETGNIDDLPGGSETILIVEDDPQVRDFVVRTLERLGYATLEAEDGPAALRVLEDGPDVDLVFTDIVMPGGMSGFELAATVSELCPAVKMLYMSGYSFDKAAQEGKLDDGIELISKPFTRLDLARRIRTVLDA